MPQVYLDAMFKAPWGICEKFRKKIEKGHYGLYKKLERQEVAKIFCDIESAAIIMEVKPRTAVIWLNKKDAAYIVYDGRKMYAISDVKWVKGLRKVAKKPKKALITLKYQIE